MPLAVNRDALREKGIHLLLSFLLSAGMDLPLLLLLIPGLSPVLPLLLLLAVCFLSEAASLHKAAAVSFGSLCLAALLYWLFAAGGLTCVSDIAIALTLRFSGQQAAFPLVAESAVIVLSLLIGLICWFLTLPRFSCLPAMLLSIGMMLILWLSGSPHLILWILPAVVTVLMLLFLDHHPDTGTLRLFLLSALLVLVSYALALRAPGPVPSLKKTADDLRQYVLDYLFFTDPRDVFSLSAEGYYPQGSGQLGGPPEISDRPVMQVSTPRNTYLRGVVLNEYNGHAWTNSTGGRRYLWQSRSHAAQRSVLFDQALPVFSADNSLLTPYTVSVRMLSDNASTLFVPQRIRELVPGGGLVPYFSSSSELFITRNLAAGDTWSVEAPLLQSGDPGIVLLLEAASSLPDSFPETYADLYTRLPDHLEQPVYDLAAEITAYCTTPYEKAFALQSWLSRNCRYTLDVPRHPENVDFVTRFLLETREGYCTYFASALTVMCRMAGLPARYVEGYIALPDPSGNALVTGMHAHAWTEVYFSGFGWLTFDATPLSAQQDPEGADQKNRDGSPDASPSPPPEETVPSPEPTAGETASDALPSERPEETPSPGEGGEEDPLPPDGSETSARTSFRWWIPCLILLLLLILFLLYRIRVTDPVYKEKRAASDTDRFRVWRDELILLLSADRQSRKPGETPLSYARRLDQSGRYAVPLAPVGELLSLLSYSASEPVPGDIRLIRTAAGQLYAGLSRSARLRFRVSRLFRR